MTALKISAQMGGGDQVGRKPAIEYARASDSAILARSRASSRNRRRASILVLREQATRSRRSVLAVRGCSFRARKTDSQPLRTGTSRRPAGPASQVSIRGVLCHPTHRCPRAGRPSLRNQPERMETASIVRSSVERTGMTKTRRRPIAGTTVIRASRSSSSAAEAIPHVWAVPRAA